MHAACKNQRNNSSHTRGLFACKIMNIHFLIFGESPLKPDVHGFEDKIQVKKTIYTCSFFFYYYLSRMEIEHHSTGPFKTLLTKKVELVKEFTSKRSIMT
jgi:hypothetical protein